MEEKFQEYKLFFSVSIPLFFFSTSSILCRMALVENYIDAYSFTFYRLFFGALVLSLLIFFKTKRVEISYKKNWTSSFMLFLYAFTFSYAFMNLNAGIGTLILFAIVQLTIIITAIFQKEKISLQKMFGILLAFAGLVYLLYPRESFELSMAHVMLMIVSGIAWGIYTILGKNSSNALLHTGENFLKSMIFIIICYFIFAQNSFVTSNGILLAFISGGITSAFGYVLWYFVLPKMKMTTAGIIQLIVPVLAILLSILFLNEELSFTLILSSLIILSGITLCIYSKN